MLLVSYNHSAAVMLTPIRSFLVLFGTGTHWWWIHYFYRLLMPSRTNSSLIRHLITSVLSLSLSTFYLPEMWLIQPLCVCLLVRSRTVNTRRRRRRCFVLEIISIKVTLSEFTWLNAMVGFRNRQTGVAWLLPVLNRNRGFEVETNPVSHS